MTTQTQNKKAGGAKVPVLRFPEFSGEWEEKQLGGIGNLKNGYAFKSEKYTENGRFKVITIGNVKNGKLSTEKTSMINDIPKDIQDHQTLVVSDMLVSMTGNVGRVCLVDEENCLLNQRVGKIVLTDEQSDPAFIYQKLNISEFEFRMQSLAQGGAQGNISKGDILSFKFFVPYFLEQQKIADFLGVVDEKIEGLSKKKVSLERYKKGVMQKIFSRKACFRDENGNLYPDWEEKKLGQLTKIYDGTHQTPKYRKIGIPFYSVEHLTSGNFVDTKFISEDIFEKENKRVKIEKDDILMTRIGDIGTSKCISWDVQASFYVSLALIKQSEKFNSTFLDQLIKSNHFRNELWRRTIHVAFPKKINLGDIGDCNLLLPSLPEQKKIADFLMSLDEKISAIGNELSCAKEFKKGLLQQMFI